MTVSVVEEEGEVGVGEEKEEGEVGEEEGEVGEEEEKD